MSAWDLFAIGDLSVDTYVSVPFFPGADQKAIGELLGVFGGGMAASFAAAAAAAGARTLYQTRLGSDPDGLEILDGLTALGVDVGPSRSVPGARTFQCYVQLDSTGEKALVGADTGVKVPLVEEIDVASLEASGHVYVLADDLVWAHRVADLVLAAGARLVVDLERSAFGRDPRSALDLAAKASVVFSNTKAFPDSPAEGLHGLARLIADRGPELTVVTDGARGALAVQAGTEWFQPGVPTVVADSTGAGDAHNGTFLGHVMAGASVPEALAAAAVAGSHCVESLGARSYLSRSRPSPSQPIPPSEEEVPK